MVDGSDKGLEYLGSLIYIRNGNVLTLESAPFSEGRIKPTSGGQEVNYHVTDHLGSVRSIVDDQGKVRATHDYLSLIHISEPTRPVALSRMPSSA